MAAPSAGKMKDFARGRDTRPHRRICKFSSVSARTPESELIVSRSWSLNGISKENLIRYEYTNSNAIISLQKEIVLVFNFFFTPDCCQPVVIRLLLIF